VSPGEFATALSRVLQAAAGVWLQPLELDEALITDVELLIRTRYAATDWTWRR
jgi:hypothetical protein